MSPRRARSPLARRVLVALASLALLGIAGEIAVRARRDAWPFDRALAVPEHLEPFEHSLRWRIPPAEGLNRLGLRHRELEPKEPGAKRVLFLGDSLVWSGHTTEGGLQTAALERRFRERGADVEVVNAGIPGYTTWQELEFLTLHGLDAEPDLVLLGFVWNDLHAPYLHRPTGERFLDDEPDSYLRRFDRRPLLGRLLGRSHLAHALVARVDAARAPDAFAFERRLDFYPAWKEHAWRDATELLREMRDLLAGGGAPLLVVCFPLRDQVDPALRGIDDARLLAPQRRLREACDELGLPLLDPTELLRDAGGPALFEDELHLGRAGNDALVPALFELLVVEGGDALL